MSDLSQTYSCLSESDLAFLAQKGITPQMVEKQLSILHEGVYYPTIQKSASLESGIFNINEKEAPFYLSIWDNYRTSPESNIVKFVPASGAASRMFQAIYPLLENKKPLSPEELSEDQQTFFNRIEEFAFFPELSETCLRSEWSNVLKLIKNGHYYTVCEQLLTARGLNYSTTPKGLIPFHKYPDGNQRTATEEHLAEGALYTKDRNGLVKLHFTVSDYAEEAFRTHIEKGKEKIEEEFGVIIDVEFSQQLHSTDTLALDENGNIFRDEDGNILLRPGGHGALIGNLSRINADVIFIKNIDNVTLDFLKSDTIRYKKLLGGVLLYVRNTIYEYLQQIERGKLNKSQIDNILSFMRETLYIDISPQEFSDEQQLINKIQEKLNRPIRVCGMVPNEGEPGGGPFVLIEPDGDTSLQILEKSQINPNDKEIQQIFHGSRFFNPVDIVCCTRDYKGNHFQLEDFVSPRAYFLSQKKYNGKDLLALEHPGLWNGAMDKWNTLFIAVPESTFTPVKSVNDLLRPEHLRQTKTIIQ